MAIVATAGLLAAGFVPVLAGAAGSSIKLLGPVITRDESGDRHPGRVTQG